MELANTSPCDCRIAHECAAAHPGRLPKTGRQRRLSAARPALSILMDHHSFQGPVLHSTLATEHFAPVSSKQNAGLDYTTAPETGVASSPFFSFSSVRITSVVKARPLTEAALRSAV